MMRLWAAMLMIMMAAALWMPAGQQAQAAGRAPALDPASCPCGSGRVCTGKRGGSYCIARNGARCYGRR